MKSKVANKAIDFVLILVGSLFIGSQNWHYGVGAFMIATALLITEDV
jgi:hypothetical protein